MKIAIGISLLFAFILGPLVSLAGEPVDSCLQIPVSFMSWRLLSTDENQYRIERLFRHPELPNCFGSSIALLDGCKEYLMVKTVFILGVNHVYTEVIATLRMPDDSWKEGVGIDVQYDTNLETKEASAIFTLKANPPVTRKIRIHNPCE